jgi:electron transfer flavoprotein beta subunit
VNILVCIKRVPDPTGEVVLTDDAMGIDGRYAGYTTSPHEEAAVELAVQLVAAAGEGQVTVLTVGGDDAEEQLRAALAVGATDAVLVQAAPDSLGPADVAAQIAALVQQREASGTAYELVLMGNDAADTGDFQVGIRTAYALGRPVVAGIQTIEVADGTATLKGEGPTGTEVYAVQLPAVVTVMEGGVSPRYPSVVGKLKAKKAPLEVIAAQGDPRGSGRSGLHIPPAPPSSVEVLGEGPGAAAKVVEVLAKLGVVTR